MLVATLKNEIARAAAGVLKSKGKEGAVPDFDLSVPPSKIKGDLAANLPLILAKVVGASPRQVAEDLIKAIPSSATFKSIEIAGPGFLNFHLSDQALSLELAGLLQGHRPKDSAPFTTEKILLEYVSANPTGPLHVGHGRGAALGDSLSRIFRYLGCNITTEFYVNDSGGQIRNLGASIEARVKEIKGEPVVFPEDGYKGTYVKDIAQEIVTKKLELAPITPAQMIFTEKDFAGYASAKILTIIQNDLKEFGVEFDQWFRESSLHAANAVMRAFDVLQKNNHIYEQDGALWFKATEFGDEKDRVLKKGNEAPTYFAADIAYHYDKFVRGFDRLINIWGADHHGYAQRVKGAMKAIGQQPEKLDIIFNQLVSIKGGRLSKRAGDMITLRDVVEEVGRDATRFFFALRSPDAHFEFDLDLAKKQASDNPVFYVQYVHARCCSIFKEAEKRGLKTDLSKLPAVTLKEALQPAERAVVLHLMEFGRAVNNCARDRSTHHLPVYLMELAGKYHSFYEQCMVLVDDEATRLFRLALVDAIRKHVAEGLHLLGVSAPETL